MNKQLPWVLALLLAGGAAARGQSLTIGSAQNMEERGYRLDGIVVYVSAYASGRATAEGFLRVLSQDGNRLELAMINDATGVYVAYALQVERQADPRQIKVTLKPPVDEGVRDLRKHAVYKNMAARFPNLDPNRQGAAVVPELPPPSVIKLSDQLKLTLWKNDETGALLGDRFRFESDLPLPPEDFSLAHVLLKLKDFRLYINGAQRNGEERFSGFSGPLPWFYVPGKGRFIVSLQAHDGFDFQKLGVLERHKLSFRFDGDEYEWISGDSILGQGGRWNVWVLHDPAFTGDEQLLKDTQLVSQGNCCLYGALSDASLLPGAKKR